MAISISNYLNFNETVEFGKLELKKKNVDIRNVETKENRIPLKARILLFILFALFKIPFVKKAYESWYIEELEKSILILKGYKETLNSLRIQDVISEHMILENNAPLLEKLDSIFQSLEKEKMSENERKIFYLFHEFTNEVKSAKATLSIFVHTISRVHNEIKDEQLAKEFDQEMALWDLASDEDLENAELLLSK